MLPGLKFNTGFTPTSISGCQLWLDAADSSRITLSGSSVTVWNDKSGNGYHMNTIAGTPPNNWSGTPAYPTIGTSINGLQTVNFVAQSGLKQATTLDGVKNLFWVGRIAAPDGSGSTNFIYLLGHDSAYDWTGEPYGGKFISSAFAQGGILNASPTFLFTPDANAVTNATFRNVNMPSAPNVSLLSVSGITGTTRYQGICYDRETHIGWCGDLAEVLIFSTALSTTQREQVEGYLAQKWGLRNNLPGNHPGITTTIYPSRRQAIIAPVPYYTQFSPTSIAGSVIWLDAADTSKYTLSGSNVTQIVDKSSNAYTFTGSAGSYPTRTTTLNGLPVISSAAGQYLQTTSFNQNFLTATSFFVVRGTEDLTASALYYMVIHGAVTRVIEIGVYGGANFGTYLNQSGTGFLYSAYMGFNPVNTTLLASSLVTGSVLTNQAYINGSLNYTGGENGTFTQLTSQTLRCIGHPTASKGYDFAEVILYGTVLTATQRQQVESYLSQKWGSTALLPASHLNTTQPAGTPSFTQTVFKQIKRTISVSNPTAPPVVSVRLINLNSASGGTTSGSFTVNSSAGGGTGTFTNSDVFLSSATWGMAQCFNGARSDYDLYMTQNPNFMEIVFPRALTVTKIFLVPRNQGDAFPSSLELKADGTSVGTYTPTTVSQSLGMGISYTGTGFYIQPSISRTTWRFDFSSTPVSFGEIEFWGYST